MLFLQSEAPPAMTNRKGRFWDPFSKVSRNRALIPIKMVFLLQNQKGYRRYDPPFFLKFYFYCIIIRHDRQDFLFG